ncbi:unnamed protein product [Hydatigera taeniaeformis]|uniref:Uncharacterized protein n=1 Tax=Hydatigena taeniaeformis TaxID=6205 RepID=A0A0R3WNB0_HYDTA|nr:unnamed protein product [Hydatigera taeniaeformis]
MEVDTVGWSGGGGGGCRELSVSCRKHGRLRWLRNVRDRGVGRSSVARRQPRVRRCPHNNRKDAYEHRQRVDGRCQFYKRSLFPSSSSSSSST